MASSLKAAVRIVHDNRTDPLEKNARRRNGAPLPSRENVESRRRPRRIGVLLLPGFPLMSYACVVESFRASNTLSGEELYRIEYVSLDGERAVSSCGMAVEPSLKVGNAAEFDFLMICAGGNLASFRDRNLDNWLRKLALSSTVFVGISGGTWMLARAGILNGRRCTIHWEYAPIFREEFPEINLRRTLYEIDGNCWSCAGGIAALDLMFDMIERDCGRPLAVAVGDWFLQTEVRLGGRPQRMSMRQRYEVTHPKLLHALELIEHHIDDPIGRDEIAAIVELSVRQLERLFREHLGVSVREHYVSVRLKQAQQLLSQSALSITEIATATGFMSGSHFARVFRESLGRSPSEMRETGGVNLDRVLVRKRSI
ncbi:GlxA family transcriptional regulator [Paraburkholderia phytofirmans]